MVAQGIAAVDLGVSLAVLAALLALSAFLSGSEVALFSLGAPEREALADDSSPSARRVTSLLGRPRILLNGILILNTLVNVGIALLTWQLIESAGEAWGWSELASIVVSSILVTFVILVTSEMTPKLIAARQPVSYARFASGPLKGLLPLTYPLAASLAALAKGLQGLFARVVDAGHSTLSGDDLKTLADVGEERGSLGEDERALIHAVVEFGDTTVREVMVSRVDVVALPDTATLGEALETIRSTGKSRFPLYRDHLDHVLGVVYAKDLLAHLKADPATVPAWEGLARTARFVPASRTLDDMLRDFQQAGTHIAIVVDEYGGTAGVVTLEDLLEEIVGEIRDEHDPPDAGYVQQVAPHTYRVDARIDLDDLAAELALPLDPSDFDFDTLGGLVYHLTGDIPDRGVQVEHEGLTFTVDRVENHRIKKVLIQLPIAQSEAAEGS